MLTDKQKSELLAIHGRLNKITVQSNEQQEYGEILDIIYNMAEPPFRAQFWKETFELPATIPTTDFEDLKDLMRAANILVEQRVCNCQIKHTMNGAILYLSKGGFGQY